MERDLRFRNCFKALMVMVFFGIGNLGFGQVTIASQDFETIAATPTLTFTTNDIGSPGSSTGFSTGTSGGTAAPSNTNLFSEGTRGYRIQGPNSGSTTAGKILIFSDVNTAGYSAISLSIRVAGMSIGSTGNGMDSTIDEVLIEVSPDGGTTWYQQAKVNVTGAGSNARWSFAGTGVGTRDYLANNSLSLFSVANGNSAGATITGTAAITTAIVTNLPAVSNLKIRISAQNNSANESWIIDDLKITGVPPITWTATGWSNTTGPTSTTDAVIAAPFNTTANGTITAKNLTIATGGSLTVNSGTNITLTEGLINSLAATAVVVENNANIVQTTGATNLNQGAITVKRNSNSLMLLDNVMWGSPVTGQQLQAFSPATLPNRFYTYDSTTNLYVNETATNNFADAKGYLIRMPNTHPTTPTVWEGSFVGVPHSGDYSYTPAIGFNSVANPYPSTMSMAAFVADNATISGTLYFWRKTNSTVVLPGYCSWNSGTYVSNGQPGAISDAVGNDMLQVGQGFIVKATATTGVLFKNTQRTGNNDNQNYKTTNTTASADEKHRVWLNLTSPSGSFSQMAFGYMTNATNEVDSYDGESFNDGNVSLSSLISNQKFVIQGRALPFVNTDLVPLNFKVNAAGNYTIAIDNVDGLFANNGQAIYLRDTLLNTEVNLSTTNYSFASAQGEFNNRFVVAFTPQTLGNSQFNANTVVIYKNNNNVVVNSGNVAMESVKVFDLTGRLLIDRNNINDTTAILSVDARNQVILVQVKDINGNTVSKKVIN